MSRDIDEKSFPASADSPRVEPLVAGLLCAALFAAILLVYWPGLRGAWIYDDRISVLSNQSIQSPITLDKLLDFEGQTPLSGRPLSSLTFALNYAFAGDAVLSYRLVNIALHALNAWLALAILLLAFKGRRSFWTATMGVVFWAIHPLNTEAVTYVTQRTELLASFFLLAAVYASCRSLDGVLGERPHCGPPGRRSLPWKSLAVVSCCLGMLCKEILFVAPLLIALFERAYAFSDFRKQFKLRAGFYASLLISWLPFFYLQAGGPRRFAVGWHLGMSAWEYLSIQFFMIPHYFRLLVWPADLQIQYARPEIVGYADYVYPVLFWTALVAIGVACWKKGWKWLFPLIWCFAILAPSSSIVPITTEVAAERRMYLPSLGLIAGVAFLLGSRGVTSRRPVLAALFALALLLGWQTRSRNADYRDESILWRQVIERQPWNWEAQGILGDVFYMRGDFVAAADSYRATIAVEEGALFACNNLAWLLATAPDPQLRSAEESLAYARKAQAIADAKREALPLEARQNVYSTLAAALSANDRFEEAQEALAVSLSIARERGRADQVAAFEEGLKSLEAGLVYP